LVVRVFDADAGIRQSASSRLQGSLADMAQHGLVDDVQAIAARVVVVDRLVDAVGNADYIQESVFERIDVKHAVSLEIGAAMRPDAVVGSSSSGIPASGFTHDVPNRTRFLVAHPVNRRISSRSSSWFPRPGPIRPSCLGFAAPWSGSVRSLSSSIARSTASC